VTDTAFHGLGGGPISGKPRPCPMHLPHDTPYHHHQVSLRWILWLQFP
jgi:hypothetical protein